MDDLVIILLIILGAIVLITVYFIRNPLKIRVSPRKRTTPGLSQPFKEILVANVPFYLKLDPGQKQRFESRTQHFLDTTRITGIHTEVTDLDKVLVAASAIIPIFSFDNWEYPNLNEVLLYPETFSEEFEREGEGRRILGMVGSGALQQVMVLSQHELRQGFLNRTGKTNTAIHEFVHLVDKTDGYTDGIPENLVLKNSIGPWLKLMHRKILEIREGKSDINPYGATNEAEFFAVAAEYFFERPDLLRERHPELFALLEQIFLKDKNK